VRDAEVRPRLDRLGVVGGPREPLDLLRGVMLIPGCAATMRSLNVIRSAPSVGPSAVTVILAIW
jgi:hypothetical protein